MITLYILLGTATVYATCNFIQKTLESVVFSKLSIHSAGIFKQSMGG
jgi:hypothetical protein